MSRCRPFRRTRRRSSARRPPDRDARDLQRLPAVTRPGIRRSRRRPDDSITRFSFSFAGLGGKGCPAAPTRRPRSQRRRKGGGSRTAERSDWIRARRSHAGAKGGVRGSRGIFAEGSALQAAHTGTWSDALSPTPAHGGRFRLLPAGRRPAATTGYGRCGCRCSSPGAALIIPERALMRFAGCRARTASVEPRCTSRRQANAALRQEQRVPSPRRRSCVFGPPG